MGNIVSIPLFRNLPPYYDPRQPAPATFERTEGYNSFGEKVVPESRYHEEEDQETDNFLDDLHRKYISPFFPHRIKILRGIEKSKPELFAAFAKRFQVEVTIISDLMAEYMLLDRNGDGLCEFEEL